MNDIGKLEKKLNSTKKGLVESFKNDNLKQFLSEEVLEVSRDKRGNIKSLLLSNENISIVLNMSGSVLGVMGRLEYYRFVDIKKSVWFDMKSEIEKVL